MMAGADFIKTSTGKENVNATLPVSLAMVAGDPRLPRAAPATTIGFKPAGGTPAPRQAAMSWLTLMKEELGRALAGAATCSASAPPACSPTSSASSSTTSPAAYAGRSSQPAPGA
jgi:deoxyribose-phosphate aldolase